MAAPLLCRAIPLHRIRLQHHRLAVGFFTLTRWPWSTASESNRPEETLSSADKHTAVLSAKDPPKYPRWDDPDFRKWKDEEAEILRDIEPITLLTKEILHSDRYMDGERLTAEDEKAVVEKLLAYHPHSEDKIGCGLDSIMVCGHPTRFKEATLQVGLFLVNKLVDRHPQFRHSRCLFVVRTDGGWIDFSYQKCLRAYIRDKYPSSAERFIREHYKRSSVY